MIRYYIRWTETNEFDYKEYEQHFSARKVGLMKKFIQDKLNNPEVSDIHVFEIREDADDDDFQNDFNNPVASGNIDVGEYINRFVSPSISLEITRLKQEG